MNIGDLFFSLRADDARLKPEIAKAGDQAGETFSAHMAASIKTKGLLGAGIVAGLGIGVGKAAFDALGAAIHEITSIIPDAINSGREFALTVDDISDKTGASAETASRFAGTLQYLGIQTGGLGTSLRTLSTEIVANESKFTKLGIATRDSNGDLLDTITILGNVRSYLSGAGDGATKMALAADLLGRSAGELIDFLNLTDAEALALAQTMDELGVTISESTRKDMEQLQRETNLLGLAWQGLSNTLASEVAPTIRRVIGALTAFIQENGAKIRETFLDITNAVLGFISGIVGAGGITPFQMQLDSIADGGHDVTLSFEQWAQQTGRLIPKVKELTGATKANTDAIDKQIDSERERADAELAVVDAQIKQLDMAEQQIAIDERKRDLNEQLNDAQLALTEAMGGTDADAISNAMANVADIQEAQAKNEHDLGVDAQRDKLQMQRDEIQAKSQAKLDELNDLKQQLAAQKGATTSSNAETLSALKAQYATYLEEQKTKTTDGMNVIGAIILGQPKSGSGLGGSIRKSFEDGQAAGEAFRAFLTGPLLGAVQGIAGAFTGIKETIDGIANSDVWKFLNQPVGIPGVGLPMSPETSPLEQGLRNLIHDMQKLLNFDRGGTVPGRMGQPRLAVVHGGETFTPPGLAAMGGLTGSMTTVVPVYLDGAEITRVVSRRQADQLSH